MADAPTEHAAAWVTARPPPTARSPTTLLTSGWRVDGHAETRDGLQLLDGVGHRAPVPITHVSSWLGTVNLELSATRAWVEPRRAPPGLSPRRPSPGDTWRSCNAARRPRRAVARD